MDTPFLTDAALQQALVDNLGIDISTAPTRWARIVSNANTEAYKDIKGALEQRGFALSQINGWDRGAAFNLSIGTYWCLVNGAGLHSYDDKFLKMLDRRPELMYVLVANSTGTPVPPTGTPPAVGAGVIPVSCVEAWRLRQFAGEGWYPGGYLYGNPLLGGPANGNFSTGQWYNGG
jgi:hypothetical protein